ncbi:MULTISPECIES: hypothetical protein [Streptomyces]|uniref:Uncharacterized protein n=1 Tax=Streptomyces edwardsiae TaxID=3075527 RepID=A0ABU2PYT3_9ACTN|nr:MULTISPECIES: hypothetical protein [unclassified Streptomyces]MDT0395880.1 hypothetical protein [Streptomyces sp. DSM 41636]
MTTSRRRTLPCGTCKGEHEHRLLTGEEQTRARKQLDRKVAYDLWLCVNVVDPETGKECRTLRLPFVRDPFPAPVRLLPPE